MSDWLEALMKECRRTSQAQAARRLRVSPAMVNLVLKGKYPAATRQLEVRVRGILLGETVNCPVQGELPVNLCQENQTMPNGPLAGWFRKSCPECPQGKKERRPPSGPNEWD